ncbi:ABC-type sugar transport system ATPase subunit [Paraburkholderia sp. WSM4179]|nr:ABC-type sugar transport system ATPase subunit [Paraburkholderia sp. WSM4179]
MKLTSIPITLTQCAKTFRGTRVLEPLDLTIGAGETLVLLGTVGLRQDDDAAPDRGPRNT